MGKYLTCLYYLPITISLKEYLPVAFTRLSGIKIHCVKIFFISLVHFQQHRLNKKLNNASSDTHSKLFPMKLHIL